MHEEACKRTPGGPASTCLDLSFLLYRPCHTHNVLYMHLRGRGWTTAHSTTVDSGETRQTVGLTARFCSSLMPGVGKGPEARAACSLGTQHAWPGLHCFASHQFLTSCCMLKGGPAIRTSYPIWDLSSPSLSLSLSSTLAQMHCGGDVRLPHRRSNKMISPTAYANCRAPEFLLVAPKHRVRESSTPTAEPDSRDQPRLQGSKGFFFLSSHRHIVRRSRRPRSPLNVHGPNPDIEK